MTNWIQEINWILIIMVTIGVLVGTEFRRRTEQAEGEIYSFLPLRMHRLLNIAFCFSAGLLLESATIAVKMPTTFHVWMLIFATAAAFIIFGIFTGLEFRLAKQTLKQMAPDTARKPMQG